MPHNAVLSASIKLAIALERSPSYRATEAIEAVARSVKQWVLDLYSPSPFTPYAIKWAVVKKFQDDPQQAEKVIATLCNYGTYYGFIHAGMFHGVEPDGYIHT